MAYPYGSFTQGQYTEADIMDEMQRSGWTGPTTGGYARGATPSVNLGASPSMRPPQDAYPTYSPTGDLADAGWMGAAAPNLAPNPAESPEEYQRAVDPYGIYDSNASTQYADSTLFEGAVDVRYEDRHVVGERLLEIRNQVVNSIKPTYVFEKIVEVPQVVVKEVTREVPKPEIVERIIEVPKTKVEERTFVGPPQVQYQEQIVEVPSVVTEEHVIRVPKREVQERLIEVAKVEYVERIEYVDFVEYREVPVDKIVEIPEIEYRVKEVEQFVPQTYIQEYYVDKYVEVPITQVQEVERVEHVPVRVPPMYAASAGNGAVATTSAEAAQAAQIAVQSGCPGQQFVTMSFTVPAHLASTYAQVMPCSSPGCPQVPFPAQSAVQPQVVNSYASYDPTRFASMNQAAGPQKSHKPAGMGMPMDSQPTPPGSQQFVNAPMPIGSQFLVPRGSYSSERGATTSFAMMQGAATPPMAPSPNPFASMATPGNPYQSVPVYG